MGPAGIRSKMASSSSAGAEVLIPIHLYIDCKHDRGRITSAKQSEAIKHSFQDREVTSVIFDDELVARAGPQFGRHLLALKVLDRTQLILDIFWRSARAVAKADCRSSWQQLQYLLPRIYADVGPLSRQTGGKSERGPGETNWK